MPGWIRVNSNRIYHVSFALGRSSVRLMSFFDYNAGRVYHVKDVASGHCDFVGAEFIDA